VWRCLLLRYWIAGNELKTTYNRKIQCWRYCATSDIMANTVNSSYNCLSLAMCKTDWKATCSRTFFKSASKKSHIKHINHGVTCVLVRRAYKTIADKQDWTCNDAFVLAKDPRCACCDPTKLFHIRYLRN